MDHADRGMLKMLTSLDCHFPPLAHLQEHSAESGRARSWAPDGEIVRSQGDVGEPILIYPRSSKYQEAFDAPYLDMMGALQAALREPDTALVISGFGFNDAPLQLASPADRALLAGYVELLDRALVEKEILQAPSNLADPWVLGCLHAISNGAVGQISKLVRATLEIALRRDVEKLQIADLAEAVDRWAIPNGYCETNPFLQERPS